MVHNSLLPTIKVLVEGKEEKALVNTGWTAMLIYSEFLNACKSMSSIKPVNGKEVVCRGVSIVTEICGWLLKAEIILMNEIIEGVAIIVGMDIVSQLGGVTIYENGTMEFRGVHCKYTINSNDLQEQWDKSMQSQKIRILV